MKKLLLILLLFFPVHGAWGKIISIQCALKGSKADINSFHIDTSEKIVRNEGDDIVGIKLKEKGEVFTWLGSPSSLENLNDGFLSESLPSVKDTEFLFDRVTGRLEAYIHFYSTKRPYVTFYDCKKRGKRNF